MRDPHREGLRLSPILLSGFFPFNTFMQTAGRGRAADNPLRPHKNAIEGGKLHVEVSVKREQVGALARFYRAVCLP